MTALYIACGGAIGSVLRYWLALAAFRLLGDGFPWGTLIANVAGSTLIGLVAVASGPDMRFALPEAWRAALLTGLFGGFTTFSAFSLQTLSLAETGAWGRAGLNVLVSVALCLVGVWLGRTLGLALAR